MKRGAAFLCCGVFLALFSAYLATLNPAFRADDSPETIASCATLGIQHPPGYPLHSLAGRLASLFPLATPAWRLNMMAAFFGASAAAVLCMVLLLWCGNAWASASAALLLGLSPTFWSQSLAAKGGIYSLHAFLLSLLLLSLSLWRADMRERLQRAQSSRLRLLQSPHFLLSILFLFLGFSNHWETQALLLPALLLWAFLFLRQARLDPALPDSGRSRAQLFKALLLALAALSVYLYLPLRARLHPQLNWGVPSTWKQFWWVLLRQEYLDLEVGFLKALKSALLGGGPWSAVAESWPTVREQGLRVIRHLALPGDLGIAGSVLAGVGLWRLCKEKEWEALALSLGILAGFCFVVTFYFHLKAEMIWILDVFLIPAYMVLALWAGLGAAWILGKPGLPRFAGPLAAALALLLIPARGPALSQAAHFLAWDYGKNFLLSLKKNAVVFAEGDFNTMPLYYLRLVKGERRDVSHVTTIFASTDWGVNEMKLSQPELGISVVPKPLENQRVGDGAMLKSVLSEIAARHWPARPLQASLFRQVQSENFREAEPFFSPSGLTAEYRAPEDAAQWKRRLNLPKAMAMRRLPEDKSYLDPSPQFALSNYGTMYMDLANYCDSHGRPAEALPLFARAVEITSQPNRSEAWTHWGIALARRGRLAEAVEKFREAAKVKPLFEAYANLAGTLNQMKRYEEAEGAAREAIRIQPQNGQSWNNLAISLYYRGRQAEAVEALKAAARLNPEDKTIRDNLAALTKGN